MNVSAQYAADHLADLLIAAQNGEDVEIANPDQARFRLTLVAPAPQALTRNPASSTLNSCKSA